MAASTDAQERESALVDRVAFSIATALSRFPSAHEFRNPSLQPVPTGTLIGTLQRECHFPDFHPGILSKVARGLPPCGDPACVNVVEVLVDRGLNVPVGDAVRSSSF
jgi:hypothetical protein